MARIGHHRIVIKTPKIHKKPLRRNDNDNSLPSTVLRSTNWAIEGADMDQLIQWYVN